jgi:CelD/BcsL family acetyltransferase involved in cellulose biosynthesis
MTPKEQYRIFCQSESSLPIFMQDWWMDAVCAGKQWDVLLSHDANGDIRAAMPYLLCKRAGMRYILMPPMTQIGGLWIRTDIQNDSKQVQRICQDIANQLQELKLTYYYQQFPSSSSAVTAFAQMGFNTSERITYRIEDLSDTDALIASFSKNKKRQLQKAQSLHADHTLNAEDFYRFHSHCMQEQGKHINYTREFLLVLDRKTNRLNQSKYIAIRNSNNDLLAAAFLVWDQHHLYYLIPCYSNQYKDSGAGALLVLETIKLAQKLGLAFDFEGSMDSGIANHYKQFGSTPTCYYSVEKYYKWWFRLATIYNKLREKKM